MVPRPVAISRAGDAGVAGCNVSEEDRLNATGDLGRLSADEHEGFSVASLAGEVDVSNVDQIAAALTDLPNVAAGLIVDLTAVEYLDSTGISLLHELAGRLRLRSQQLIIVCPPTSPPRRVLELTALDTEVPVLDELGSAVERLRQISDAT
jgi:anti-anti-sigma factor